MSQSENTSASNENLMPDKPDFAAEVFGYVETFVFALIAVIFLLSFAFRFVILDGSSMEPTLNDMDRVIMSTHLFLKEKTGDIVVLDSALMGKTLIKRVIATGGQTVDINPVTGAVSVDGTELSEEYIAAPILPSKIGDFSYPLTVPEGFVYVMGDNRNVSADSRVSYIGLIDTRYVIGKVYLRIYPFSGIKLVK